MDLELGDLASFASQLLPVVRANALPTLNLLPKPCNLQSTNAGARWHPPTILAFIKQEDQPGLHTERPSRQKIDLGFGLRFRGHLQRAHQPLDPLTRPTLGRLFFKSNGASLSERL